MRKYLVTFENEFGMENIREIRAEDKSEVYQKAYEIKSRRETLKNIEEE